MAAIPITPTILAVITGTARRSRPQARILRRRAALRTDVDVRLAVAAGTVKLKEIPLTKKRRLVRRFPFLMG